MATKKTKTSSRSSAAQSSKATSARASNGAVVKKKKTSSKAKTAAAASRPVAKKKSTASKASTATATEKKIRKKKTKSAAVPAGASTERKKTTADSADKAGATTKVKSKKKVAAAAAGEKKTTSKTKTTAKSAAGEAKIEAPAEKKAKTKTLTKKKSTPKSGASAANNKGYSVAEVASKAQADAQGYVFINGRRVRMISTKGVPVKKPVKSNTKGDADDDAPVKPKNLKTHLTRKQLNHYRDLLLEKRREIIGDLGAIEQEALRNLDGGTHMPIHMADVGTDTYDQDFMLGLAEAERKQLMEIDDALMRIQQNTYGVCVMTGNPIPEARLEAKPWAKYTIEAARQVEGNYGP